MSQHYTEYDGRGGDDPCSHCGGTELGHPSILRTCPGKASRRTYPTELEHALEMASRLICFDSRDWSTDPTDALLYGLLVGWSDAEEDPDDLALAEVGRIHDWSNGTIEKMKRMNRAVLAHIVR